MEEQDRPIKFHLYQLDLGGEVGYAFSDVRNFSYPIYFLPSKEAGWKRRNKTYIHYLMSITAFKPDRDISDFILNQTDNARLIAEVEDYPELEAALVFQETLKNV